MLISTARRYLLTRRVYSIMKAGNTATRRDLVARGYVIPAGIYVIRQLTRRPTIATIVAALRCGACVMNKQTTLTPRGEQFYALIVAGLFIAAAWVTLQLFARVVIFTAQFLGN